MKTFLPVSALYSVYFSCLANLRFVFRSGKRLGSTLLLFFLANQASAFPLVYHDEAGFLQAAGLTGNPTEDFESIAAFGSRSGGGFNHVAFNGFSIRSVHPAIKVFDKAYSGSHNVTYAGRRYLSIDTDLYRQGTEATLLFDSPLRALGFWIIDQETTDLTLTLGSGTTSVGKGKNGQERFVGLLATDLSAAFQSVKLDTGRDSQVAFDNFWWSTTGVTNNPPLQMVSEPPALLLLLVGMLSIHLLRLNYRRC